MCLLVYTKMTTTSNTVNICDLHGNHRARLVFALVGESGKVKQSHLGLLRTASKQSLCATAQNTKQ